MPLSWNEIKVRAVAFAEEWADAQNEDAEAKPFLIDFFSVFGISQKRTSSFEHRVKKLDEGDGYIDLLWKGVILVEMKSRGKNLDRAYDQAKNYLHGLKDYELPKFILVCDFERFRLHELIEDTVLEFQLEELVHHVHAFGHLIGYQTKAYREQDPANIKAAELMGKLHDRLEEIGYTGHNLEVYLVRILFCLFAEDTTIFEKQQFQDFIAQRTAEDGSDLAAKLNELFQVLNTPSDKRFSNLDEQLAAFPYINGKLFEELLPTASFDTRMRTSLLNCCSIDWANISPAIFGSMFQSVMNPVERRSLGAHYTSEKNILRLIEPLFLDELKAEFEQVKGNPGKLYEFHKKLGKLTFLDPACGCGNFLVITYRELRDLELDVLRVLRRSGQLTTTISNIIYLNVDQFYGIEIEEFPARIAEVAMWLMDHQMNMKAGQEFGQYFLRLPLTSAANITHGDALDIEWNQIVTTDKLSYIIGNPPFLGSKMMTQSQRDKIVSLFPNTSSSGTLDFVTGWYIKAARYIQGTTIKAGFVSTNSIVQGEQVAPLWGTLLRQYGIHIHFAHRTFKWSNEARGNAAVYCVIIGFAAMDTRYKVIFDYPDIRGEPVPIKAANINPYLVDAPDVLVEKRSTPISCVPNMSFGNMPLDGGHLLLDTSEKEELLLEYPEALSFIRPFISAKEFLNGGERWCIWLVNANPSELRKIPPILERVEKVKEFRLSSIAPSTRKFAATPTLFRDRNEPSSYVVVPRVSSENRAYIPIGFFTSKYIAGDTCMVIPHADTFHFGILSSSMHMAWVRHVCGRLKSDFRYSKDIVYNNFPWPPRPDEKTVEKISEAAQAVLDTRTLFPEASLADLYDPRSMPEQLVKAHQALDKAADQAYRSKPFKDDGERMAFLFDLYQTYTSDLADQAEQAGKRRSKKKA